MNKGHWKISLLSLGLALATTYARASDEQGQPAPQKKEWTLLVFLNGNNNLDDFGFADMNEMESVGSNANLNIVVQWASISKHGAGRYLVTHDNDTNNVGSQLVQDVGNPDMGDVNVFKEFVKWGTTHYPADHYMIEIWNHGSGWHDAWLKPMGLIKPMNISFDDNTGNSITTAQMGSALKEISAFIGQKVDIYGSDACLMNMIEVASEIKDSVNFMVGSEETEPGDGWPYGEWLKNNHKGIGAEELGSALVDAYVTSYKTRSAKTSEVTFSMLDLRKLPALEQSIAAFVADLIKLPSSERAKIKSAGDNTQAFAVEDYKDLGDFLSQLKSSTLQNTSPHAGEVETGLRSVVYKNQGTSDYSRATGLSIWIPDNSGTFNSYKGAYSTLKFQAATHWADLMDLLY